MRYDPDKGIIWVVDTDGGQGDHGFFVRVRDVPEYLRWECSNNCDSSHRYGAKLISLVLQEGLCKGRRDEILRILDEFY